MQAGCERLSFEMFHHYEVDTVPLADVEQHADVWMIQR
jgi:hypothetical protein